MRRPWRRRGFGGGGAFRSRALISEAACCCKAAAVGRSAVQCGVADEFLIGGGSNTQTGLVGVALGASALGLGRWQRLTSSPPGCRRRKSPSSATPPTKPSSKMSLQIMLLWCQMGRFLTVHSRKVSPTYSVLDQDR
ncbi:uncharacterized protein LOC8056302 isoform X1 [Sorghum bicolor]|nr:uncharacterized protein LOC8056302 isoform X1 [Sorghum bicolor]XP_021316485.1 uncharacterized protein LOC8056302 isoform X1 [Sorghum bicolor]XP_021316486.1 uncharacterized protein LOC8056302 isoform X1 [Sorghum bicolor]|eukprot:XP_021316484.1 uncharacterized protein LOC8056302 isoform X1 [Sorghum bicolor]